ncbi:hypothetical protein D3C84_564230 [compost metagenome]
MGGQRLVGRLVLDVVELGAAYDVFLLLQRQLLPVAQGMDPALHVDVGAAGELTALEQRHLGPVLTLGVLGAIDEASQIPAILVAEAIDLLGQLHQTG